jgi:hypothetical protein
MNSLRLLVIITLLGGCRTIPTYNGAISIREFAERNVVRVTNESGQDVTLYYNYAREFDIPQMFRVRFRDANQTIIELGGAENGWFTPLIYSASLTSNRRRLSLPARNSIDISIDVGRFASWVRRAGPPIQTPCDVQIKLLGYVDNNLNQPMEATTEWRPGPCPR